MRKRILLLLLVIILVAAFCISFLLKNEYAQIYLGNANPQYEVGDAVDSLNGVKVFYNGSVAHTGKRHLATDGYNYGLRWQCVEFVKRYYYDYLHHTMPDTYGHAKDFFEPNLADGAKSTRRNLIQYKNGSSKAPQVNDLLVFDATAFNQYGHVAIVSKVDSNEIEMIQQNPGPTAPSRVTYAVEHKNSKWTIDRSDLLGWLRKQ